MNMLRLSGVWSYGSRELYRLCDRHGILVWQDFPFANMDYPIEDEGFREEVEHECREFLHELRTASLACGPLREQRGRATGRDARPRPCARDEGRSSRASCPS